jgi:hypothetical protein
MLNPEQNPAVSQAVVARPTPALPGLVKWAGIIAGILLVVFQIYQVYLYYTVKLPAGNYSSFRIIGHHFLFLSDFAVPAMAIWVLLRSKHNTAFYLALFFIVYQINVSFNLVEVPGEWLMNIISAALAGTLCVFSFQYFPRQVMQENVEAAVRYKWLRRYLDFFLHQRALWLVFFPVLLILYFLQDIHPLSGAVPDLLILPTAFIYLYVNFRTTKGSENDSILWLFWGLFCFILLTFITYTLTAFSDELHENIKITLSIAFSLVLLFSLGMSLFFSDTFNTGSFITRTFVNGIVFALVIVIYNTLEHYVLHWLAHKLHISNVMMSSFLSGIIVLAISPVHHRLTHFLNKRLRK